MSAALFSSVFGLVLTPTLQGAPPRAGYRRAEALSRSERVRATISVFTLTVLRRLINATSADSIKSKQWIATQVECPRHVLTRTRTRGAEGQRTQRHMRSNDPSSFTAAGNARLIRQLRGNAGPPLSCSHGWTPSPDARDCRFYARYCRGDPAQPPNKQPTYFSGTGFFASSTSFSKRGSPRNVIRIDSRELVCTRRFGRD